MAAILKRDIDFRPQYRPGVARDRLLAGADFIAAEEINRAIRSTFGGRKRQLRLRRHFDCPDRNIGIAARGPRFRWWKGRVPVADVSCHDRDLTDSSIGISETHLWNGTIPKHSEMWLHELVFAGEVQPDLKELE